LSVGIVNKKEKKKKKKKKNIAILENKAKTIIFPPLGTSLQ